MPTIKIKDHESFDGAMRRFKRACEKAGIPSKLRQIEFYEKPTTKRKRKKSAAVKRQQKRNFKEGFTYPTREKGKKLIINMASPLYLQIQEDMKNAMRAKDTARLGTIRMLIAAIRQREIDERITLDDTQIYAVLDKMIKQRQDSIAQYNQGNRTDLVAKEKAEIEILEQYLPQKLTDEEITKLIQEAIDTVKTTSLKDMAKVMAHIKPKAQGRADLGKISTIVKSMLK